MGYVQEARENHVKKKVEEDQKWSGEKIITSELAFLQVSHRSQQPYTRFSRTLISWMLTLRSKMKTKALKECDQYTSEHAQCAVGRTISVVWQCRKQAKELNDCLHHYTDDTVLEEMKREYMLQQEAKGSVGVL